jgi:hypothetical protein
MLVEADVRDAAALFGIEGEWQGAEPLGSGHIHQTWTSTFHGEQGIRRFIHQCLNESIFADLGGLMRNVERVTDHLRRRPQEEGERWEVPRLQRAPGGVAWCRDSEGRAWRTWERIEGVVSHDVAGTPAIAGEAARAFGRFLRDLADFDPSLLVESIAGFHDLEGRLARLRGAVSRDSLGRVAEVGSELARIEAHAPLAKLFARTRTSGKIPRRVVHNDTKVNNALFDVKTGRAVAVVDLDTVMPGTLLFDYGDLIRTAACPVPEDSTHPEAATVDVALFDAVSRGFVEEVAPVATSEELDHLLLGARFMTLIVGVRFLTDHLEGDVYFRIARPRQNLDRARVQLRLLESLEEVGEDLERRLRGFS